MKTEVINVTPAIARMWLTHNTSNRPLRNAVVERLGRIWARGEWKLTHQGIAFAPDGTLLDGQHRLTFISRLPEDAVVPMLVFTNVPADTFSVLDQGVRRTASDVLDISSRLASVAGILAFVHNSSSSTGLTPTYVAPFVDLIRPGYETLMLAAPGARRLYSSASVMAAASLQIVRKRDEAEICAQYSALINFEPKAMSQTTAAFVKRFDSVRASGGRKLEMFVCAMRMFDTLKPQTKKLVVADQAAVLNDIREYLRMQVSQAEKSPAGAGRKVAKPSANSTRACQQASA